MERETIPLNPLRSKTPPQPITEEQYQIYLIGKHVAERVAERNAYVPFSKLSPGPFKTNRKAKLYLDKHKEIRRRKPSLQRLEVNAIDWFASLAKLAGRKPTREELDEYLDNLDVEKEIAAEAAHRRKRRK